MVSGHIKLGGACVASAEWMTNQRATVVLDGETGEA
jgi:hypothetical protein